MNIVLVGAGKIGLTLAQLLAQEKHNITVIDRDPERIARINATLDVITICGSVDIELLKLADTENASLLIAATDSDEANILCCMVAKKLGVKHTIARVRQKEHYQEVVFLREELGLSLTINPEFAAAAEISRVLRFPSAAKVESFAKGQAELVDFRLTEENPLCGKPLRDYHASFGVGTLVCAAHRGEELLIPDGNFVPQAGDVLSVVGSPRHIHSLFRGLSIFKRSSKYVLIVGAGRIGVYLATQLTGMGIHVKFIEKDREKCDRVKALFPKVEVVCGDGSRPDVLEGEGMAAMDAFVALTGTDEINIIISTYARAAGVDKVVCKVNEDHYAAMTSSFSLEEPVQPRYITALQVLQYVRGMENSADSSGVEMLRRLMGGRLEVLEFRAKHSSRCVGQTLQSLPIRPGVLVAAIIRDGKCIIPGGSDEIWAGDSIIAVTSQRGMRSLEDILKG